MRIITKFGAMEDKLKIKMSIKNECVFSWIIIILNKFIINLNNKLFYFSYRL